MVKSYYCIVHNQWRSYKIRHSYGTENWKLNSHTQPEKHEVQLFWPPSAVNQRGYKIRNNREGIRKFEEEENIRFAMQWSQYILCLMRMQFYHLMKYFFVEFPPFRNIRVSRSYILWLTTKIYMFLLKYLINFYKCVRKVNRFTTNFSCYIPKLIKKNNTARSS